MTSVGYARFDSGKDDDTLTNNLRSQRGMTRCDGLAEGCECADSPCVADSAAAAQNDRFAVTQSPTRQNR